MRARNSGGRRILSTGDVAKACKVAPRTVSMWCDTGELAYYRLPGRGRDRRIYEDDLIAFCARHGLPCEIPGYLRVVAAVRLNLLDGLRVVLQACGVELLAASTGFDVGTLTTRQSVGVVALDFAHLGRSESLLIARGVRLAGNGTRLLALCGEDEADRRTVDAAFDRTLPWPHTSERLATTIVEILASPVPAARGVRQPSEAAQIEAEACVIQTEQGGIGA